MAVNVIVFGSLTDIVKGSVQLENIADTNSLVKELNNRYPGLEHAKYMVSVNKKMINSNTALDINDTVALMPPFSGG
jgi:sulfur-carrier protein